MKIFITGATGFIGSHLVQRLLQSKHELNCLVRKNNLAANELKKLGVNIHFGDVTNKPSILPGMKGCDSVINIAGLYSFWEPDEKNYSAVNIDGTRNVMECAVEANIKKVVHISTAGVYGKPEDDPFNEKSSFGMVQISEYFRTKYEGERIAWDLFRTKALPLVVIYPVCVVGPGDTKASGRYIHDLINRKMPATIFINEVFSFVYVKDVAQAIVNALEKENNIGEKYLIGSHRYKW